MLKMNIQLKSMQIAHTDLFFCLLFYFNLEIDLGFIFYYPLLLKNQKLS